MSIAQRPRTLSSKLGYVEPCSLVYSNSMAKSAAETAVALQEDPSFRLKNVQKRILSRRELKA